MVKENYLNINFDGEFNAAIHSDKGIYTAKIIQWNGDILIRDEGKTPEDALGKAMLKFLTAYHEKNEFKGGDAPW